MQNSRRESRGTHEAKGVDTVVAVPSRSVSGSLMWKAWHTYTDTNIIGLPIATLRWMRTVVLGMRNAKDAKANSVVPTRGIELRIGSSSTENSSEQLVCAMTQSCGAVPTRS